MLFVISPAKSLDYERPLPRGVAQRATEPLFLDDAAALIETLAPLTPPEVAALMALSDDLAQLNVGRYAAWRREHDRHNSRPAVMAFDGDVYDGLQARSLDSAALGWAQAHLVILSGLYGVLRPFDRLQPYRLEMGTRLATARGADLYAFWGARIAEHLNQRLADDRHPVLVNLASQEYFRAVDTRVLRARVVECVFEDWKDGRYKIIGFFAKRARGAMVRWAIEQRARSPKALTAFDALGYLFDAAASQPDRLVFRRRLPAAAPA